MQVSRKNDSDTKLSLTISAAEADLRPIKQHVLGHFAKEVKIAGFRAGKAPLSLIEKQVDQNSLQAQFLSEAINTLYQRATAEQQLRTVEQPSVTIKKFVPFTTLEFTAAVSVMGPVRLADYKKIKLARPMVQVSDVDIHRTIESLQTRLADRQVVKREAEVSDEVVINFQGTDDSGQAVAGADAKDYPLILGSDSFIPGFEKNILGLKTGVEKSFTIKFPKDYGVKALAGKPITFAVKVKEIRQLTKPAADDALAAKAGPFTTMQELTTDIRRQLTLERERQAELQYESELVRAITAESQVAIPEILVAGTIKRLIEEVKQNLVYRGQTYQEFLRAEKMTDEQYREKILTPQATERVKASLVLAEIAELEKIEVSPKELETRMQVLKRQYQDKAMQAELNKPESRQDIASRLLSEKTISRIKQWSDQAIF
ncbi:trigger factor [Candidatus Saccharibacteria bacterium]|nr:trigger factor [Candidatus Saccharibacteria bacterium]